MRTRHDEVALDAQRLGNERTWANHAAGVKDRAVQEAIEQVLGAEGPRATRIAGFEQIGGPKEAADGLGPSSS